MFVFLCPEMHLTVDIGKATVTCFSLWVVGIVRAQASGWHSGSVMLEGAALAPVELDPHRHFYRDEKVCTLEEDRP